MLKYVNYDVVFSEIPNETTLAINLSNCPCHCKGCHSPYLAEDIGTELGWFDCIPRKGKSTSLYKMILANKGITCVAFMGGDNDPRYVNELAYRVKNYHTDLKDIKVAWYSGRQELAPEIYPGNFDYIKLGPYIEELGGLSNPKTNQRLYKITSSEECDVIWTFEDITKVFWK